MTMIEPQPPIYDTKMCRSGPDDERRDPGRCVYAHQVRRQYPWAKHVTVGKRTVSIYDYRCEHNPSGKMFECAACPGRHLTWATPLTAAQAIEDYDRGGDPVFPGFMLREDEAKIEPAQQDKIRKREQMRLYNERVKTGEIRPNRRSPKAKARARSDRRKG